MQPYPIDIHTHRPPSVPGEAIVCCPPGDFHPQEGSWYSIGIHPWRLEDSDWEKAASLARFESLVRHPQVLAVGEAGLDRLAQAPLPLQTDLFRRQTLLAETVGKPLIIHAVKAQAELIALKRELQPAMPWVIHGFRGKPQMAESLSRHGFHLSFGEKYQPESLRITPADRLFLETDESTVPIADIYARAAATRGITAEKLRLSVEQNVHKVFLSNRLIYKR